MPLLTDVALMLCLVLLLSSNIVTDHSVELSGEGFLWNDVQYVPCAAVYTEGDAVAQSDSGWSVCEVEEDPSHTFLVLRSFLDQQLCVREDYEIPCDGTLSAVFWNGKKVESAEFCAVVREILNDFRAERVYQTDAIFSLTDAQQMRDIAFCWDDCPVGVDREDCWIGTLDGDWVFAKRMPDSEEESELHSYAICQIPNEYAKILEAYSG